MEVNPINILLADDDIDDCKFFGDALGKLPSKTILTIVHDGERLMKLLTNETIKLPDVVFLDINMPRKNGFECLNEIKQNEKLKNFPVVIFSTSGSQDNIKRVFKTGAHVYIRKPGNFAQLKQVILHALPIATEKMVFKNQLKYILNA